MMDNLHFQISKKMKYFGIYCFTVLPLVLHVCCDNSVPMLDEGLKITNCSGLKLYYPANVYLCSYYIFSILQSRGLNLKWFFIGGILGSLNKIKISF